MFSTWTLELPCFGGKRERQILEVRGFGKRHSEMQIDASGAAPLLVPLGVEPLFADEERPGTDTDSSSASCSFESGSESASGEEGSDDVAVVERSKFLVHRLVVCVPSCW